MSHRSRCVFINPHLIFEFSEEESESEGDAEEGPRLLKTRDDIKRSSQKVLRLGKAKESVPEEVSSN